MNENDILLLLMFITYLFLIISVYTKYKNNPTISSIICDNQNKYDIFFYMIIMTCFTFLYELNRGETSLICILLILVGIFGVIFIFEPDCIHYSFAFLVFSSILYFMYYYCKNYDNFGLNILFLFQIEFFMMTLVNFDKNMFFGEMFYILNFAIFYLILHFFTRHKL